MTVSQFTLGSLSVEFTMLALAIILGMVHIFAAAQAITKERGIAWNTGPRDETPPLLGKLAGRLDRASKNFQETFAFFAVAVVMLAILGRHSALSEWGATLYLVGRIVYLPLYAAGVKGLRSLAWLLALIGIAMLMVALFSS